MMTERTKRCWNAKMKRFSFEGRSWGMTVERGVFLIPPSFLAKRGRPNEDGMKKVEWFSYGLFPPELGWRPNQGKPVCLCGAPDNAPR